MGLALSLRQEDANAATAAAAGPVAANGVYGVHHANHDDGLYARIVDYFNKKRKLSNPNDLQSVTFAAYFFMAGKRFKNLIGHTQNFLFGDNLDLNFILSHKPVVFPYDTPTLDVPSKYLQSLINIRKDTVKLVKCPSNSVDSSEPLKYSIEFRFDCDCDTQIRIHYFATEKFSAAANDEQWAAANESNRQLSYNCGCAKYIPKVFNSLNQPKCICLKGPDAPVYKRGANILFQAPGHTITPAKFHLNAWQYNINTNYFPIVIECLPVSDELRYRHSHVTLAYLDKSNTTTVVFQTSQYSSETNVDAETSTTAPASTAATAANNNSNSISNMTHNDSSLAANQNLIQVNRQNYLIKPVKQKQFIDGLLFSLQEIYGIEKKSADEPPAPAPVAIDPRSSNVESSLSASVSSPAASNAIGSPSDSSMGTDLAGIKQVDELLCPSTVGGVIVDEKTRSRSRRELRAKMERDMEEREQELKGIECVICMCETRDTLILPCRHLCLCKLCAINLRIQSNNCPICRIPFIALLQLKLLKRKQPAKSRSQDTTTSITLARSLNERIIKIDTEAILGAASERHSPGAVKLMSDPSAIDEVAAGESQQIVQFVATGAKAAPSAVTASGKAEPLAPPPRLLRPGDQYEAITIYEAFNGASLTLHNQEVITSYQSKETQTTHVKKTKKSKNKTNRQHGSRSRSSTAGQQQPTTSSIRVHDDIVAESPLSTAANPKPHAEHAAHVVTIKSGCAHLAEPELSLNNLEAMSGAINHLSISSIELKESEQIHLQELNKIALGQKGSLAETSSTMI